MDYVVVQVHACASQTPLHLRLHLVTEFLARACQGREAHCPHPPRSLCHSFPRAAPAGTFTIELKGGTCPGMYGPDHYSVMGATDSFRLHNLARGLASANSLPERSGSSRVGKKSCGVFKCILHLASPRSHLHATGNNHGSSTVPALSRSRAIGARGYISSATAVVISETVLELDHDGLGQTPARLTRCARVAAGRCGGNRPSNWAGRPVTAQAFIIAPRSCVATSRQQAVGGANNSSGSWLRRR